MKKCTNCGEEKEDNKFYKRLRNKGGLSSWCKECTRERNRKRYHERKNEDKKEKKKKEIPKNKYIKKEKEDHYNYYFVKPRGCTCNGSTSFCIKCYIKSRDVIQHIKKNNDNFWNENNVISIELSSWEKKKEKGYEVVDIQ